MDAGGDCVVAAVGVEMACAQIKMIRPHRKIHRAFWLIFTPLLLALVLAFSRPHTELSPANAELPAVDVDKGHLP